MKKAGVLPRGRIDYHLDATAGWAAFEDLLLDARTGVVAAFHGFDVEAPLRTDRARAIGANWFDLLLHSVKRGLRLDVALDAGGVCDTEACIAAFEDRVAAASHDWKRHGTLAMRAVRHPLGTERGFQIRPEKAAHRMNLAVVDGRAMFLSRTGLAAGTAGHDLSIIARGPVVTEAETFLTSFADVTAGTVEPAPVRRLLRTLSRPAPGMARLFGARTVANEIDSAHHMLIRRAERLIHIETHAFESPALARHIASRAKAVPGLRVVLLLARDDLPGQRKCITLLRETMGERFFVGLATGGIANISIFDDQAAITGSADLEPHALGLDSHVALYLRQSDGLDALHQRLALHWLGAAAPDPEETDAGLKPWREVAEANRQAGGGVLLPWSG